MPISSLLAKELTQIKTDKRSLALLFTIPLILIVIFGLATGGGPTAFFNVQVISRDQMGYVDTGEGVFGANSSAYEMTFRDAVGNSSSAFGLNAYHACNSTEEYDATLAAAKLLLKQGVLDAIIILPENFTECVKADKNVTIETIVDGTDKTAMTAFELSMEAPVTMFRIQVEKLEGLVLLMPSLEYSVPSWGQQILNYAIPMLIPIIIIGTTMNLTSLCIVSEAPLPRLFMTPTGRREIIFSKLIIYSAIMILQSVEVFVGVVLFGLYCAGSLLEFFLALILIGFVGICMGMFISAIAPTEQTANQMYIMLFIMITMFSGGFIPMEGLPAFILVLMSIFPLSHATPLLEGIMMRGLPFGLLDGGYLLLLSGVFFAIAFIAFKVKNPEV